MSKCDAKVLSCDIVARSFYPFRAITSYFFLGGCSSAAGKKRETKIDRLVPPVFLRPLSPPSDFVPPSAPGDLGIGSINAALQKMSLSYFFKKTVYGKVVTVCDCLFGAGWGLSTFGANATPPPLSILLTRTLPPSRDLQPKTNPHYKANNPSSPRPSPPETV